MTAMLGHYEIEGELGRGGMGVVLRGYEPALGRAVAIKQLSPALSHDPALVERFLREARSMAALNDPHIVPIYYIGQQDGQPFFAMEFVDGVSLSEALKRDGRLSLATALNIVEQAARGLATAHEHGVIHRDIKPGNLLITKRGQLKLADFGIALATADLSAKLTSTGEFVGTPGYLSPEVCLGKPVDARSDIFALGIVLYEMLAGKTPFTDESPLGLMLEVVQSQIPDVRALNLEVDAKAAEILAKMLQKDPADRYADAQSLVADLDTHPAVRPGTPIMLTARADPATSGATVVGVPVPSRAAARAATPPPEVGRTAALGGPTQRQPAPGASASASPSANAGTAVGTDRVDSTGERPTRHRGLVAALVIGGLLIAGGAVAWQRGFFADTRPAEPISMAQEEAASTPANSTEGASRIGADSARRLGSNAATPVEPSESNAAAAIPADDLRPEAKGVLSLPATDPGLAAAPSRPGGSELVATAAQPEASSIGQAAPDMRAVAAPTDVEVTPADQTEPGALVLATDESLAKTSAIRPARKMAAAVDARQESRGERRQALVTAPRGVAVVELGDRALTRPAAARLDAALSAARVEMSGANSGGASVADALRGLARSGVEFAIVVEADTIGSQPINFYGQSDTMYTATLSVRAYNVATGQALGSGLSEQVQFTAMSASKQAELAVGGKLQGMIDAIARAQASRG